MSFTVSTKDAGLYSVEYDLFADNIEELLDDAVREAINRANGRGYYDSALSGGHGSDAKRRVKNIKQTVAEQSTARLEQVHEELRSLIAAAVQKDNPIDWEQSKRKAQQQYEVPERPKEPVVKEVPREPQESDVRYRVNLSLLDRLIPPWRRQKEQEARAKYEKDHAKWLEGKKRIERENAKRREEYEATSEEWKAERKRIEEARERAVANIDQLREDYYSGEPSAVEGIITSVLEQSGYPIDELEAEPEVAYNPGAKMVVVDRPIPSPEDVPDREEIKYVKTRDAFKVKKFSKRNFKKLYEAIPYQIALRTIYEVFDGDEAETIEIVVFNGWVTSVNPATGHEETVCTLSVQASREEIMSLNLKNVDPKSCFKGLKGVSASKLMDIAPVTPIQRIDREDSRFAEGRAVGENLEEGENIAAMDWEDFEHLIRELFEKEFSKGGGEVKVTQASRDGGIDAVAFDPDPLRGGKIVIQAKRYTRTVGVSAVRDLYGTVMNEGANKGILVTTSDYGPDAYNFAKDKPIQLLNGGNLLSLLERHGYDARIDVEGARENR